MANILDSYLDILQGPMRGLGKGRFDIAASITKGLRNPIGSAEINKLYGSPDAFMESYKNLEGVYKSFLAKEMPKNMSVAQKRMLQAAQSSPVMNFSLIKDMGNRRILNEMIRGNDLLNVEGLLRQVGPPSIPLPSSNLITEAARYGIDARSANHYAADLINSLTISIDPTKEGARAFGFGTSGLPTAKTLENMGRTREILDSIVSSGRNAKILTIDTETSGLGALSEVRSLAGTEMQIGGLPGAGRDTPVLSAHFSTKEMQMITVPEAGGGTTNLAKAAFNYESSIDTFAGSLEMRDLLTPEGRLGAVEDYKNIFRRMTQNDFILFHNAKFDVEKISTSVFNLGEDFFKDAEAANLFKGFQTMVEERKSNQQFGLS